MALNELLYGVILSEQSFISTYAQVAMKFMPPVIRNQSQTKVWAGLESIPWCT